MYCAYDLSSIISTIRDEEWVLKKVEVEKVERMPAAVTGMLEMSLRATLNSRRNAIDGTSDDLDLDKEN